jgi:hypothetical protein
MLLNFLVHNPVAAILLWVAVYFSDYYLTLYGARLYRSGPNEHIEFEGSYELTAYYERDIDQMRRVSTRFLIALAFSAVALFAVWLIGVKALRADWLMAFLLGGLVLREAAVHLRHLRNIVTFGMARKPGALQGKLTYPRWFLLRSSAFELIGFGGLYLFGAALGGGWFFLGGGVACLVTGFRHLRRARKVAAQPPAGGAEVAPGVAAAAEPDTAA